MMALGVTNRFDVMCQLHLVVAARSVVLGRFLRESPKRRNTLDYSGFSFLFLFKSFKHFSFKKKCYKPILENFDSYSYFQQFFLLCLYVYSWTLNHWVWVLGALTLQAVENLCITCGLSYVTGVPLCLQIQPSTYCVIL